MSFSAHWGPRNPQQTTASTPGVPCAVLVPGWVSPHSALWTSCPPYECLLHSAWAPTPRLDHPSFLHGFFPNIPWTLTFRATLASNELFLSPHLGANSLLQAALQRHPLISLGLLHWMLENSNTHDRPLSHTDIFLILQGHWQTALIHLPTLMSFSHSWSSNTLPLAIPPPPLHRQTNSARAFVALVKPSSCEDALLTKLGLQPHVSGCLLTPVYLSPTMWPGSSHSPAKSKSLFRYLHL